MGAKPASADVEIDDGASATVKLSGEHDLSDSDLLRVALRSAASVSSVLIDLSACTYMDLSAIGRLMATDNLMRASGGHLELFIPPEAEVMWLIARRTGLATCMNIRTTRPTATQAR
jgi:anti-anti-sigma factor